MHARGSGISHARVAIYVSSLLFDGLQKKERLLMVYFKSDCPAYVSIMCHQVGSIVAFEKHFPVRRFSKHVCQLIH